MRIQFNQIPSPEPVTEDRPANEQERHQVGKLCDQVRDARGQSVQIT